MALGLALAGCFAWGLATAGAWAIIRAGALADQTDDAMRWDDSGRLLAVWGPRAGHPIDEKAPGEGPGAIPSAAGYRLPCVQLLPGETNTPGRRKETDHG